MRILVICANDNRVATYVRAYNLARGLSLMAHDVTFMAVSADSRLKTKIEQHSKLKVILCPRIFHAGFVIDRLTSSGGCGPLDILERIKVGMSGNYDIVQMFDHFPNITIPFNYLRKRSNMKFVSDWCDIYHLPGGFADGVGPRVNKLYRSVNFGIRRILRANEVSIRRKADAVTVISQKLRRVALDCGVEEKKINVIEGGVDTDKIKPLSKEDCKRRIGFPPESKVIVFLGRSQFDLDILIRSFARVRKILPNSYLMVVGMNLFKWAKDLASDLGVINGIKEVGYSPEEMLPFYLSSADVFGLPLKKNLINETRWPNKIGEYMACGRPTVVSDVGDVAEVVQTHRIGLVARPDVDSFSEKMQMLLSNDRLAEDMGRRARELACKKYSWGLMAGRLEKIYFGLLNSTKKGGTKVDERYI